MYVCMHANYIAVALKRNIHTHTHRALSLRSDQHHDSRVSKNRRMLLKCHTHIMHIMCVSSKSSCLAAPSLVEGAFTAKRSTKRHHSTTTAFAGAGAGGTFSLNPLQMLRSCETCRGKGAIECPGCKGTGKNKKNGNIFERWKCFDCQGFGLKSCPSCGKGRGLTPEQRGER